MLAYASNLENVVATFTMPLQWRTADGTRLIWPIYSIVIRQLVDTLVITTVP
jgi:hypothetical protein